MTSVEAVPGPGQMAGETESVIMSFKFYAAYQTDENQ
jgi:hypothetical protein